MDLETAIQSDVSQKEMNVLSNTQVVGRVCFLVGVRQGSASCPVLAGGCPPPPGVAHIPCHVGSANVATSLFSQQGASLE